MPVQNILCDNVSHGNSKDVMNSQLLTVFLLFVFNLHLKIYYEGKIKKKHEGMTPFN